MTLFAAESAWQEPAPRRPRWGRRIAVWLLVAIVPVAAGFVILNPVRITDQITVWTHQPSSQAMVLADRSGMTDDARFVFYASQPQVQERTAFNAACSDVSEQGVILGCYVPLGRTIHLFDVVDPRLDGLQVVTAAHEMLHARWARMSSAERTALAPLLEAEATRLSTDAAFTSQLALYAGISAEDRLNELHSILGTAFSGLDPVLERHYAESFRDRPALVALHQSTDAVFTTLKTQSEALVAELDALRAGIESDSTGYTTQADALDADIGAFNDRWSVAGAGTQEQYDAERSALSARRDALDALYDSITDRRAQFDATAGELEALNVQVDGLNAAIDSRATP